MLDVVFNGNITIVASYHQHPDVSAFNHILENQTNPVAFPSTKHTILVKGSRQVFHHVFNIFILSPFIIYSSEANQLTSISSRELLLWLSKHHS